MENPNLIVELRSHTDCRGSDRSNLTLSQKRAESCVNFLVNEMGVPAERLIPRGLGETTPAVYKEVLASGDTLETKLECGMITALKRSEPEKFDPNRWISSSCPYQNHSPKSIKAFGGGARLCPGMHLSVIEMTSVISGICKNFEVKLEGDPKNIKGNFAFTVSPENLKLTFKKNGS